MPIQPGSRISPELAEREGFEPSIPLRVWQISSLLASTACVPLHWPTHHSRLSALALEAEEVHEERAALRGQHIGDRLEAMVEG